MWALGLTWNNPMNPRAMSVINDFKVLSFFGCGVNGETVDGAGAGLVSWAFTQSSHK